MYFYMFGMDENMPESSAKSLKQLGFSAVVCPGNQRCVDAVRENGMDAYVCVGAFPQQAGSKNCVDVYGNERIWFSSGCPNDAASNRRNEEKWQSIARLSGLNGMFIDGARYASPASPEGFESLFTCFCPDCMEQMEQMGFDSESIREDVRRWRDGKKLLPPSAWLRFRSIVVAQAMRRFVETVKTANGSLRAGAFVFPHSLGSLVGQTPDVYTDLDIVAPMIYRCYMQPCGPATLNHECAALYKHFGAETTRLLTGIDVAENVLEEGFPPEIIGSELRQTSQVQNQLLAPIIQLDDARMPESIASAKNNGAHWIGFLAYNSAHLHFLPELSAF